MLTGFRLLARLKGLRGTPFDLFGRTDERREERALIAEYRANIEEVLTALTLENHATAVEIARIPELIKGYGHVKARHLAAARPQWTALMQAFRQPAAVQKKQAA
jgi:indolepyruvate ferredoxin oxidoreductase